MKQIVGLGAGGHAKGVIEILRSQREYYIVGLLDPRQELHGTRVVDIPVLGGDDLLPKLERKGVHAFFVGVGGVGDNRPRQRLFEMALGYGMQPVNVVHLCAVVSPSVLLGGGDIIMAGAVINSDAVIGANVIVNTAAVVEHDCVVHDHAHISTGSLLAGGVHVGSGAHIGIGAAVKQGVNIGVGSIVGAGATVIRDVRDGVTVIGVPAHEIYENLT